MTAAHTMYKAAKIGKVAGLVGIKAAAQRQAGQGECQQTIGVQAPGQRSKGQGGEKGHQDRFHADAAKADMPVQDGEDQGRTQACCPAPKEFTAQKPGQGHGQHADDCRQQTDGPGLLPKQAEGEGHQVDGYGLFPHVFFKEQLRCRTLKKPMGGDPFESLVKVETGWQRFETAEPESRSEQDDEEKGQKETGEPDLENPPLCSSGPTSIAP